ncbi:Uncharacterized protein APZ42_027100 [Daphnia magna]|uniref:Uncharacterized protein n=1 Tax=Daphnia magna TaxID=35525 RepID=A0A0N8D2M9_9CRUS|nr:Uncharacterized protein APZ42_027100 [Daphnia magna]
MLRANTLPLAVDSIHYERFSLSLCVYVRLNTYVWPKRVWRPRIDEKNDNASRSLSCKLVLADACFLRHDRSPFFAIELLPFGAACA